MTRVGRALLSACRSKDESPAPVAVGVEVCADTALLAFDDFARIHDATRPLHLSLSGRGEPLRNPQLPKMVAHATAAGSRVDVVTDGTLLDPGRAYALVEAGLTRLEVTTHAERVLRNIERLVALRDANRKPGPQIAIQLVLSPDRVDPLCTLLELCHRRFEGIEPVVRLTSSEHVGALAELRRARALAKGYGLRGTVRSIDLAIVQLTRDLGSAPCYVPWYACHVSTDGEVYPCRHHPIRGTSVGNALREPFPEIWNGPRMRAFRARADRACVDCRHEDGRLDRVFRAVARVPGLARARFGG